MANNFSNFSFPPNTNWEGYVTSVFLSFLIVLTLVGNMYVVVAIFIYKPLRSVQNFFVISLSVADMAVAILVMPFHISNILFNEWIYGFAFCDLWLTFDILLCTASILNICVIALDRYFAIHDPLNYAAKRTIKRVLFMIVAAWVTSAAISVPPLFGWSDKTHGSLLDPESGECHLTEEKGFVIYSACGSFYIPLAIMSFVYLKIFLATRKRLRERAKASAATKLSCMSGTRPSPNISSDPASEASNEQVVKENKHLKAKSKTVTASDPSGSSGETRVYLAVNNNQVSAQKISSFFEQKQRISLSKERRAARILGFIMGAFIFCWLPFFLYYVIMPFCPSCMKDGTATVEMFVVVLGYVNSSLNPIIYTVFNNDFQKAFQYIYVNKLRCKSSRSTTTIKINGQTMV
ncbi:tyramine/octopamine receptor-like [Ylistrum balloti]|uniref:tyramine/octopamine receptor-like n=1 Tax=Ylistrum balloti TaxID=509963 RepID=UPI002905BF70|nr:tyramine/octopamine receptor-like [Ylistrum balloti]